MKEVIQLWLREVVVDRKKEAGKFVREEVEEEVLDPLSEQTFLIDLGQMKSSA